MALLMLAATAVMAQREVIDRIVAIVGDEVILASEVASQMQLTAMQTGRQPRTEAEAREFRDEVLEQMINDRLFLIEARKDTSITVRPEEIDEALDNRISQVSSNFGSNEEFLDALSAEGLTLRELRKKFRTEVENQLLKQRLIQSKLYTVSVSKHEVIQFFEEYKDSIPAQPEAVQLAHILLTIEPSKHVQDSIRARAEELRQMVLDGADFGQVSEEYSSLGAGANGGDIGWVSQDDVVPEFARAAFNLRPGGISGVVQTEFGFHIIKAEDKSDDRMKLRHILLAVQPTHDDTVRVYQLADSLINEVRNGASFGELAKIYSYDDDSRTNGGELGWFATSKMPPEFVDSVQGWTEVGTVRGPVATQFGLHILKLLDYQPEKMFTLEDDFDQIKELARQDKTGKVVDDWIQDIRKKTYVDIRNVE